MRAGAAHAPRGAPEDAKADHCGDVDTVAAALSGPVPPQGGSRDPGRDARTRPGGGLGRVLSQGNG